MSDKPLHDQIRRQGEAAQREMQSWPERMRRNLPEEWFDDAADAECERCDHPRREHRPTCVCGCDWKMSATRPT